ncbi:helix-turn-helix domain-containing protein [Streptomyces sp. NPDC047082]|uniref:helix-turn-helix domain-containing protein n=1 Tax=Streptomyces sp. NPDC047082 TaxID=3155259 RepID=UPI0033DC32C8
MREEGPAAVRLASELRRLRAEAGDPTLKRIRNRTGASEATLSRIFSGQLIPSEDILITLVDVLRRLASGQNVTSDFDEWVTLRMAARRERETKFTLAQQQARPEQPFTTPDQITSLPEAQQAMRSLLTMRGLTIRAAAKQAGLARSTLFDALTRDRLPSPSTVTALLLACSVKDTGPWLRAIQRIQSDQAKEITDQPNDRTSTGRHSAVKRSPTETAVLAVHFQREGDFQRVRHILREAAHLLPPEAMAEVAYSLLELTALRPLPDVPGPV